MKSCNDVIYYNAAGGDIMKKENSEKKPIFNVNATAIKNVIKSKEVRKAAKNFTKALKGLSDSFDINKH